MYRNNYNPLKTKPGINLTSLVLRKEGSLRRVILAIYFGFENIMNILSYMKDVKNLLRKNINNLRYSKIREE